MAIRNILQIGDETLRKKSFEVTDFGQKTQMIMDDLKDTVKKAEGAGLAAPQVGILRRMFVVDVPEGFYEFINPVFIEKKGVQIGSEGCLSVKGKYGEVERPNYVKVKAQNRKGEFFEIEAEGFFARAICHEYDHLDGILYVDKAKKVVDDEE